MATEQVGPAGPTPTPNFAGLSFEKDVLPTARAADGSRNLDLKPDSRITIQGVEGTVSTFLASGHLKQTDSGYKLAGEDGTTKPTNEEASTEKVEESFPGGPDSTPLIDREELAGFGNETMHAALSEVLAGEGVSEKTLADLAQNSGLEEAEVREKIDQAFQQYYEEAEASLSAFGLHPETVFQNPDYLEALTRASKRHVTLGDSSGYREVGLRALADAIKADPDGFIQHHEQLGNKGLILAADRSVVVDVSPNGSGQLMDLVAAVRAGLVRFDP